MHLATLHLGPILGAEKSRVPFYIAGGALVAWALIVSVGFGLRRADFPGTTAGERMVIAISALLVLVAISTAVITSGGSTKAVASGASGAGASGAGATGTSTSGGASTAPATSTPAAPKATIGTPAPPSSPAAGAGPSVLKLAADPGGQLSYNTKLLSARAGLVTIDFANASPLEHDVTVAEGGKVLGQTPIKAGPATLRLNLKPGTYTFYCAVPGHRQGGMEGTLTVS